MIDGSAIISNILEIEDIIKQNYTYLVSLSIIDYLRDHCYKLHQINFNEINDQFHNDIHYLYSTKHPGYIVFFIAKRRRKYYYN